MALDYVAIGKRIRTERKRKKITQEKLAELADLSSSHVSGIETANTQVSLRALVEIANALDVTPDILLCDNLKSAKDIFTSGILTEIKDCSELELRIISDIILSLKLSIRKRTANMKYVEDTIYR